VTETDDLEVLLEVQFEDPQRVLDIGDRCGDGHQRQYDVTLLDVVLDPFLVDGDVTFQKMETRVTQGALQLVAGHIETEYLPLGGGEDAMGKCIADKTVDTEDEDFHGFS
jgi:hypothetical protein